MDRVGPTNGVRVCFAEPEKADLASLDQVPHGSRDILNRYLQIHAVLVRHVDDICAKSAKDDPQPKTSIPAGVRVGMPWSSPTGRSGSRLWAQSDIAAARERP